MNEESVERKKENKIEPNRSDNESTNDRKESNLIKLYASISAIAIAFSHCAIALLPLCPPLIGTGHYFSIYIYYAFVKHFVRRNQIHSVFS